MFSHPIPRGRRRTLDRAKKRLFCDAVSRGATMREAALAVGVSLRTVQREARLDPDFDQELRVAHADKPDSLSIMRSAARTHWRAAAWLLERENSEDYGRRPANSCTPFQFDEGLKVVVEAALRLTPPDNRGRVYAHLSAACETAFQAVFPNYGRKGMQLLDRLPKTPLADAQSRQAAQRVPDPLEGRPSAPAATPGELALATERAAGFIPAVRTRLPESEPPELPANSAPPSNIQHQESSIEHPPLAESESDRTTSTPCIAPPPPAVGRDEVLPAAESSANSGGTSSQPTTPPPAIQHPETSIKHPASRLPWRYILRAARTKPAAPNAPISASAAERTILSLLSPKTHSATKSDAQLSDIPLVEAEHTSNGLPAADDSSPTAPISANRSESSAADVH